MRPKLPISAFRRWLLEGYIKEMDGPFECEKEIHRHHSWYKVMCLTGVDYFSTLGYQPGIAFLAAGALSPVATIILVLLTLLGALPIYRRVTEESPHGEGSISMLAKLLSWWQGKLFILVLLGFVATDFIITITLSAADATAHIVENPLMHNMLNGFRPTAVSIGITLALISLLSGVFIKGFKEAIGIAVVLVTAYLILNLIVLCIGLYHVVQNPSVISSWQTAVLAHPRVGGNWTMIILIGLLVFPKLALGLSGFETGVAVMPLVEGDPGDTEENPRGRIRNTKKLLFVAALIMSVLLIASSFITTLLISPEKFRPAHGDLPAGEAAGRALAYLAHDFLGPVFGTVYDVSTILILWFAGASAMAGLLNIVPRYLPRYGMAPDWTRAMRPLVIVFTIIAFAITLIFKADVNAQGGAYATGVLVLMSSAAVAVTISALRRKQMLWATAFALISVVFAYTTVVNVIERPDGIKIAGFFIALILLVSLLSRIARTTELRVESVEIDETAQRFLDEAATQGTLRIITNCPEDSNPEEYRREIAENRQDHNLSARDPILFLEVEVRDASEFANAMRVEGAEVGGYRVLRAEGPAVPNTIAAFLLYLRDQTGKVPHAYFHWGSKNPIAYLFDYVAFGRGDTAPVTREVLRQAEPDEEKRPAIHVGGY
ncbi:MAG TPA: amino acid transporter [Blastocatellia bacterium]|nr:amino acid transporter [Blastocatellia bacterium]